MANRTILGVYVNQRTEHVPDVQKVFTDFGCIIKTRIGLHEVSDSSCSPNGLILLELYGDEQQFPKLESALAGMGGVEVKKMVFGA